MISLCPILKADISNFCCRICSRFSIKTPCWNSVIDAGISSFDEVNNLCGMERKAVESEVPEGVRATTRITLDDALKKQIEEISLRTDQ